MKYNVDYFIAFFSCQPEGSWGDGFLYNNTGQSCALGKMGFKTEAAANSKEDALALAGMIAKHLEEEYDVQFEAIDKTPEYIIPMLNDSSGFWTKRDGIEMQNTVFGETPEERILTVLQEIKSKCLENA